MPPDAGTGEGDGLGLGAEAGEGLGLGAEAGEGLGLGAEAGEGLGDEPEVSGVGQYCGCPGLHLKVRASAEVTGPQAHERTSKASKASFCMGSTPCRQGLDHG